MVLMAKGIKEVECNFKREVQYGWGDEPPTVLCDINEYKCVGEECIFQKILKGLPLQDALLIHLETILEKGL